MYELSDMNSNNNFKKTIHTSVNLSRDVSTLCFEDEQLKNKKKNKGKREKKTNILEQNNEELKTLLIKKDEIIKIKNQKINKLKDENKKLLREFNKFKKD